MTALYAVVVDLTGSNAGPLFGSVRHLLDGSRHTPQQLRELTAERYDIPLGQVGEAVLMTQEQFDALPPADRAGDGRNDDEEKR